MRLILAVVLLLVPVCLSAQEKEGKKGPPPTPKNLKVLTGESGEQVIMTMRAFRTALGVQCTFCHVQGDFASDDNPKKETARMMLLMARDINWTRTLGQAFLANRAGVWPMCIRSGG